MNKTAWMVVSAINVIAMLAMLIIAVALGGCGGTLECSSGTVPMKCHWCFLAVQYVAIAGIVCTLLNCIAKGAEARRKLAWVSILIALAAIIICTPGGIGVCANAEMSCNTTALLTWICGGISIVLSLIQIVKGNPADADKPKMGF